MATTSLPSVDRLNANRWNAARSCQNILVLPKENCMIIFIMLSVKKQMLRGLGLRKNPIMICIPIVVCMACKIRRIEKLILLKIIS